VKRKILQAYDRWIVPACCVVAVIIVLELVLAMALRRTS
jgi:hypothetical protein